MKLIRTQWTIAAATIITAVLAIVTNLATFELPDLIQPYLWISWPVVLFLTILLVVISVIGAKSDHHKIMFLDENAVDQFARVVSEAEQITSIDPVLEHVSEWAEKLATWEATGRSLAQVGGINNPKINLKSGSTSEQIVKLLMRLTKAIEPALSHRGHWNELIELSSNAYKAGVLLQDWSYATHMAYTVALKLYYLEKLSDAEKWIDLMEDSLKRMIGQSNESHLQLMFFELKGIIVRDFRGEREEANKYLESALKLSKELKDSFKRSQILAHLGKLREISGKIEEAICLYEQALEGALKDGNPDLKLDCYDKLGRLAFIQGRYDDAYNWYHKQLELAKESLRVFHEGRAHEGVAWVFFKQNQFKDAYFHARQALVIEVQITGPRAKALQNLVITIADKELLSD